MKKTSLLLLAAFTVASVFAQTSSVGLKGGVNLASTTNNDFRTGFHVGFLAHMHMGPNWALQPELVYSSQGTEYIEPISRQEHKLKLDYLNVPFLFQYFAAPGLRLQTGPQVGFLLNVDDEVNGVESGFFEKRDFKDIDASWTFGLSYIGRSGFGVDARYNLGLSNNNNPAESGLNGTTKNSVIQAGIFYQFSGR